MRRSIEHSRADALLVTHLPNVFYLCGFTGSNAVLLVFREQMHLFTDSRYTLQARQEAPAARIHIGRQPAVMQAGKLIASRKHRGLPRVGFDPVHLSQAEWLRLRGAAGRGVRWKPLAGLVESLREIKSPGELEAMRQAAKLGSEVMEEVISLVKPGVSELDLAAEADYRMRRKGASGPSFDTIVASGPALGPSARPAHREVPAEKRVGRPRPGCYTPPLLQRPDPHGLCGPGASQGSALVSGSRRGPERGPAGPPSRADGREGGPSGAAGA